MAYFITLFLDLAIPRQLSNYGVALSNMKLYLAEFATGNIVADATIDNLRHSLSTLSAKQVEQLLVSKSLNQAQFDTLLSMTALTEEEKEYIRLKYQVITADTADTASKTTTTFSWKAMTVAIWDNIKATVVWLATNPLGQILLIGAALGGLALLFSHLDKAVERHIETIQKLDDEYKSNESELKTLSDELETIVARIKELEGEGLDTLSLTQAGELEELRQSNNELEREILLLQLRNKEIQAQRDQESKQAWRKMQRGSFTARKYYETAGGGVGGDHASDVDYAEYLMQKIVEWRRLKDEYYQTAIADNAISDSEQKALDNYDTSLKNLNAELSAIRDTADAIGHSEADAFVDKILAFQEPGYAYDLLADSMPQIISDDYLSALYEADQKVEALRATYNALVDESQQLSATDFYAKLFSTDGRNEINTLVGESGIAEAIEAEFSRAFQGNGVRQSDAFNAWIDSAVNMGVITDTTTTSIVGLLQKCRDTEDVLSGATQEAVNLAEALEAVSTAQGLLDDIKSDIKDSQEETGVGNISLDTLQSIIEEYSDLEGVVQQYINGQTTAERVMEAVEEKFRAASDAANYYEGNLLGIATASTTLKNHLSVLASMEADLGALSEALGEFGENGIVTAETLSSLQEVFGENTAEFAAFVNVAGNSRSTFAEVQAAVNNLAVAYLDSSDCLKNLTEDTKESTIALLQMSGVTNAAEVVESQLQALALQQNFMVYASENAVEATWENIEAFATEAGAVQNVISALKRLQQEELAARITATDFTTATAASVSALLSKANALNLTSEAAAILAQIEMNLATIEAYKDSPLLTDQTTVMWAQSNIATLEERLKALRNGIFNFEAPNLNFDVNIPGTSTGNSKDPWLAAFEEEYNAHKHAVEMGQETLEDFYTWLDGANQKYFANNAKYLDEYRKYSEEVYNGLQGLFDDELSDGEHQIFLWEQEGGQEDKIVAEYRRLQARIEAEMARVAQALRDAGWTEAEIANSEIIQKLQKKWWDYEGAVNKVSETVNGELRDGLEDLLELTKKMIKQEKEDEIEALEKQIDSYREIIELRKDMLALAERERAYNEDVADQTSEIAELEQRAAALRRAAASGDRRAALELAAIEEKIRERQKKLDDTQHDHAVESTEDRLDSELSAFEREQQGRIAIIQEFLNNNELIHQAATQRLSTMNQTLFDELLSYALQYTDTTGAELQTMWTNALTAAGRYGSFVAALNGLSGNPVTPPAVHTPTYHTGTPSAGGSPTLKQNELFAKILKGEMILNQPQQSNLWTMLSQLAPVQALLSALGATKSSVEKSVTTGAAPQIDASLHIDGNLPEEQMLETLRRHERKVANMIVKYLK